MTAPADLREQAYRLEIALQREPGDARAALVRAVAARLRAMADELILNHPETIPDSHAG